MKNGDVYKIPITESTYSIGQIQFKRKHDFLFVAWKKLFNLNEEVIIKDLGNPDLMSITLDSRIYHKIWKFHSNQPVIIPPEKLPLFKIGVDSASCRVVNFRGEIIRNGTEHDWKTLLFEFTVAPIRFDNCIKSAHGYIGNYDGCEKIQFNRNYIFE